jgi:hypothetical protein
LRALFIFFSVAHQQACFKKLVTVSEEITEAERDKAATSGMEDIQRSKNTQDVDAMGGQAKVR